MTCLDHIDDLDILQYPIYCAPHTTKKVVLHKGWRRQKKANKLITKK